ncbi:MAG: SH3 domain-containing protein [Comamonas sp.]
MTPEQYKQYLMPHMDTRSEMEKIMKTLSPKPYADELIRQLTPSLNILNAMRTPNIPDHISAVMNGSGLSERTRKIVMGDIFDKAKFHRASIDSVTGFSSRNKADALIRQLTGMSALAKIDALGLSFPPDQHAPLKLFEKFAGINKASDYLRDLNPGLHAMLEARKTLDGLWPDFKNFDHSNFQLSEEDEAEFNSATESIAHTEGIKEGVQQFVEQAAGVISKQKNPHIRSTLLWILCKIIDLLLNGAVGAAMGYYAPTVLGNSPQGEKKAVQQNARDLIGSSDWLREHRFVSSKSLAVRLNPKSRSPEIGRLHFGYTVYVLKKQGDFSLIQWKDKDGDFEMQGWVFSRYLEKFK